MKVRTTRAALVALCLLSPILMGGCPDFQNASVDAVDTAVRGIVNAALDLFFEQFRSSSTPSTTR